MAILKEETIRVLPFSGKKTDWIAWEAKILAKLQIKGWKAVVMGTEKFPTDKEAELLDPKNETGAMSIVSKERNEHAYLELLLSMDTSTAAGEVAFGIVNGCNTTDNPNGNSHLAFEALKKKYAPYSAPTLVKLSKEFNSKTLERGADPDEYISEMERLRKRIKAVDEENHMSDKQFIIVIINNLPPEYEMVVNYLERRLDGSEGQKIVTIEEMRDELNLRFERMQNVGKVHKAVNEHALVANSRYKGKCKKCGRIGHMAKDCWGNRNNVNHNQNNNVNNVNGNHGVYKNGIRANAVPFEGKCHFCGVKGHKASDCRKKKANEVGQMAHGEQRAIALMAIDIKQIIDEKQEENSDTYHDYGNGYDYGYGYDYMNQPYNEEENDTATSVYSGDSTFFDNVFDHESCFMATEQESSNIYQKEDDDDVDEDMHPRDNLESAPGYVEYMKMTEEEEEVIEEEFQDILKQRNRGNPKNDYSLQGEVTLLDKDSMTNDELRNRIFSHVLQFRNHVSETGIWDQAMGPHMKKIMYKVRMIDEEYKTENQLEGFFMFLFANKFWLPKESAGPYAVDMCNRLSTVGIVTVKSLVMNVQRLTVLLPDVSEERFPPIVLDTILYYGVEWLEMNTMIELSNTSEAMKHSMKESMKIYTDFPLPKETKVRTIVEALMTAHAKAGIPPPTTIRKQKDVASPKRQRESETNKVEKDLLNSLKNAGFDVDVEDDNNEKVGTSFNTFHLNNPEQMSFETLLSSKKDTKKDNPKDSDERCHMSVNQSPHKRNRLDSNTWLADSGASSHMTHNMDGMFDVRTVHTTISVGNGEIMHSNHIGTMCMRVVQQNGEESIVLMKDVLYIPMLTMNLFSITKALHEGYMISNFGIKITLTKRNSLITFDKMIKTHAGAIIAVDL